MSEEVNKHERQAMWCDGCKKASIAPGEKYTRLANGNFCQDCEPVTDNVGAHG